MKLEALRAFDAVARKGHFTRAAEQLFLAQPSLSRQIGGLEAELGVRLFDRLPTGAALTAAGESLLPIARRMLADEGVAKREMQELAGLRRGRVRLGAPPTLCVSMVADVLASYRAEHPGVELVVSEAGSHVLVDQLAEGSLDLAMVVTRGQAPRPESIELVPLLSERLVVISSAQHPFPAHAGGSRGSGRSGGTAPESITLSGLARLPQVAFNRSYDLRAATDAAFAAAGLVPTIAVEGAEMDAVLRFVERGLGVAVVSAMVTIDRPGLRSTRLVRPALDRTVNLARRIGVGASPAVAAMEAEVFATVERLTAPGAELARLVSRA